jgi:hypothetical protein
MSRACAMFFLSASRLCLSESISDLCHSSNALAYAGAPPSIK